MRILREKIQIYALHRDSFKNGASMLTKSLRKGIIYYLECSCNLNRILLLFNKHYLFILVNKYLFTLYRSFRINHTFYSVSQECLGRLGICTLVDVGALG